MYGNMHAVKLSEREREVLGGAQSVGKCFSELHSGSRH